MLYIIDGHVHLVTLKMVKRIKERTSKLYPQFKERIFENYRNQMHDDFLEYLAKSSLQDIADDWIEVMDKNELDHAVFFPISENLEQIRNFVNLAPDRFTGYVFLDNPAEKEAPDKLRKGILEYGLKGLKIYPSIHLIHANDKALFPLYEEAESLGIPITIHFGITNAPVCDYRYTNPLDLQLSLKLFPKLNFIIAHFGAGFFREICLLAFHNKNIYLDTSGTNNWRAYLPEKMMLKDIFKKAIEVYSTDRIIFGTDTVFGREKEYRSEIKDEQMRTLDSLWLSDEDSRKILYNNAASLYNISL